MIIFASSVTINIMKRVFIFFSLLCIFAQSMTAQLTALGLVKESNTTTARVSGYSLFVPEISFVDNYLYVGTPNGLYRNLYQSQAEWEKLPLTDELVLDFEVRGDTLIVLTCTQLLCSWDGGKTVIQHPLTSIIGKEKSDVLQGMEVHPHDATHIFVGTNWSGSWCTHDGGSQWEEIYEEDGSQVWLDRIYFNPHDNNKLFGIYNNKTIDFVGFYYSTDGGSQWTSSKGDYRGMNIAKGYNVVFHPTKVNRMIACGWGIYAVSDDAGASWSAVLDPKLGPEYRQPIVNITDIVYDTQNPDILYGADNNAFGSGATTVCRSTDGGYTWEKFFSDTIAPKGVVLSIDMKDNILALYTYGNGIYLLDVDAVESSISPIMGDGNSTPYHDLQGRKVAHPTRGIYIKDGKKVVIK